VASDLFNVEHEEVFHDDNQGEQWAEINSDPAKQKDKIVTVEHKKYKKCSINAKEKDKNVVS